MVVELKAAVRLRRNDVLRLSAVHRRQFALSIANGKDDDALDFIEGGGEDGGEHGLVYVRVATGDGDEYEGFLLDAGQYPRPEAQPDGGFFFLAGTTDRAGFEISQGCFASDARVPAPLAQALETLLRRFPVAVRGAALKANPPFELATAPKPPKPVKPKKGELVPLALEVVSARRYTEAELRAAPPDAILQCCHALRPKFAPPTTDRMKDSFAVNDLYISTDPGPDSDRDFLNVPRTGLFLVRLAVKGAPGRTFDGWFRDERSEDPAAWWPSRRARATTGRVMLGGTTTYALVAVEKGRVVADKQKATPDAFALAEGLKKLGLDFDVEVRAQSTKPGFFGSKHHYRQLDPPGQERVRTRVST